MRFAARRRKLRGQRGRPAGTKSRGIGSCRATGREAEAPQRKKAMSIIGWIVLGLIAGFIASKIVNKTGEGVVLDIILGIVGAIVGGFLFNQFGAAGVTGFNIYSMVVAVLGAIVVLFLYHALFGRRAV
jgi:uncharacterized membrane protein YeaQ/YmgE (transglycosylase-associated protein family)